MKQRAQAIGQGVPAATTDRAPRASATTAHVCFSKIIKRASRGPAATVARPPVSDSPIRSSRSTVARRSSLAATAAAGMLQTSHAHAKRWPPSSSACNTMVIFHPKRPTYTVGTRMQQMQKIFHRHCRNCVNLKYHLAGCARQQQRVDADVGYGDLLPRLDVAEHAEFLRQQSRSSCHGKKTACLPERRLCLKPCLSNAGAAGSQHGLGASPAASGLHSRRGGKSGCTSGWAGRPAHTRPACLPPPPAARS